jgi:hypothetical protein
MAGGDILIAAVGQASHDVNRDRELNVLCHYCYYYSHN